MKKIISVAVCLWSVGLFAASSITSAPAPGIRNVYLVGSGGVTANKLVKKDSTGTAVIALTTSDTQALGLAEATVASGSYVTVDELGSKLVCAFDAATTTNDFVIISTTAAASCHDSGTAAYGGTTAPTGTIGIVNQTIGSAGTAQMQLFGATASSSSSGPCPTCVVVVGTSPTQIPTYDGANGITGGVLSQANTSGVDSLLSSDGNVLGLGNGGAGTSMQGNDLNFGQGNIVNLQEVSGTNGDINLLTGTVHLKNMVAGGTQVFINPDNANAFGSSGLGNTNVGYTEYVNATSGVIKVAPPSSALGTHTLTLPDVTGTLCTTSTCAGTVTSIATTGPIGGGTITSTGTITCTTCLTGSTPANHGVMFGAGTQALSNSTAGASGTILFGQGAAADPSFAAMSGDATITGSGVFTLATVNAGPGACGDATHVCAVTTNGKGLVTAQTATAITGVAASSVPFSGVSAATNTNALVVGTGGSLGVSGTGAINATTLLGSTWASPAAIGSTTPSSATFTSTTFGGISGNTAIDASGNFTSVAPSSVIGSGGNLGFSGTGILNANRISSVSLSGLCQTGGTGCPISIATATNLAGAANSGWYNSASGTTSPITSTNNGLVATNGSGVPAVVSTLPNGPLGTSQTWTVMQNFSVSTSTPVALISNNSAGTILSFSNNSSSGNLYNIEAPGSASGAGVLTNNGLVYHDVTNSRYPFWYSNGANAGIWSISAGIFGWSSNATDPRGTGTVASLDTGMQRKSAGVICSSTAPASSANCLGTFEGSHLIADTDLVIAGGTALTGTTGTGGAIVKSVSPALTGSPTVNAKNICLTDGTNCPGNSLAGHTDYWNLQSGLFSLSTLVGAVYYEPQPPTNGAVQLIARLSGTISCTVAPVIQVMDMGVSVSTVYAGATQVQALTTGTGDGTYISSTSVTLSAGHYYGLGFSSGTCITAPTFDITWQLN